MLNLNQNRNWVSLKILFFHRKSYSAEMHTISWPAVELNSARPERMLLFVFIASSCAHPKSHDRWANAVDIWLWYKNNIEMLPRKCNLSIRSRSVVTCNSTCYILGDQNTHKPHIYAIYNIVVLLLFIYRSRRNIIPNVNSSGMKASSQPVKFRLNMCG